MSSVKSLEPTYEGLKLLTESLTMEQVIARLEPTYEGLKPPQEVAQALKEARLEPTYEGLKRMLSRWARAATCGFGAYL